MKGQAGLLSNRGTSSIHRLQQKGISLETEQNYFAVLFYLKPKRWNVSKDFFHKSLLATFKFLVVLIR